MKGLHTVLAAALLLAGPALAADDDLAQRIAVCTHEHDDARRLACFDRAAAPKAAPQAAAQKVDATEAFGVHGSELARNSADDKPRADSLPKRISATVAAIEKRAHGELVVTLDNGQVWAQKEAGAYFPLKVGDPVAILAGTLGSFRLLSGNRATAVTRVQ